MNRQGMRGFSLLEAIVALAILATAGLALFASMSQSVQMVSRAERAREADSAVRNAVAWIETVNPMQTPQGEQDATSLDASLENSEDDGPWRNSNTRLSLSVAVRLSITQNVPCTAWREAEWLRTGSWAPPRENPPEKPFPSALYRAVR